MMTNIPEQPKDSFRVTLTLGTSRPRIDQVLLEELRLQDRNIDLKHISRTKFKTLFKENRIQIKGQRTNPSSSLAQGTTIVDILGFSDLQS